MSATKHSRISEADYLAGERDGDIRHEYVNGEAYAMAGAKSAHNRIAGNLHIALGVHLRGSPCEPFMSDMKVKAQGDYFYPDILVDCSDLDDEAVFTEQPRVIIEVLSESTRRLDSTTKKEAYRQLESLQEYVLVEQITAKVEVFRRRNDWGYECFFLGDELSLESIGLTISVEDIYARVKNEEVLAFVQQKGMDQERQR